MNAPQFNRRWIQAVLATAMLAGLVACAPTVPPAESDDTGVSGTGGQAAPTAARQVRLTVPQGTELNVSLSTAVGSDLSQVGDAVTATTLSPVIVGDRIAIPAGSTIHGHVDQVFPGTKGLKISEKGGAIVLAFDTVRVPEGSSTPINASIARIASSKGKTAGIIVGSAAGGALLGKILGDSSKDTAVGAVLGGGIGTGIAAGTRGKELNIPAGTELTMILDQALSIVDRS